MTWTDERVEIVTKLWSEGLTASAIGRRIGVTKNAIVGKVHRLGLPARQSPIRKPVAEPVVEPEPVVELTGPPCHWPIGEPGKNDFRYCGKAALAGKPYCPEHDKRAYIRQVPRRGVNAA